jgi:hypothetical protein
MLVSERHHRRPTNRDTLCNTLICLPDVPFWNNLKIKGRPQTHQSIRTEYLFHQEWDGIGLLPSGIPRHSLNVRPDPLTLLRLILWSEPVGRRRRGYYRLDRGLVPVEFCSLALHGATRRGRGCGRGTRMQENDRIPLPHWIQIPS